LKSEILLLLFFQATSTSEQNASLTGLTEGTTYMVRVAAENEVGVGEFAELSKSVVPKSQYDVPGAPSAPEVSEVTKESCQLSWTAPEEDGGSPVTGYFIERSTAGSSRWLRVNKELAPDTSYTVDGLIEDTEYVFRIVAVNKVGEGEPGAPSKPITAKDPWGKLGCMYWKLSLFLQPVLTVFFYLL